jgi:hypothetical protein
MIDVFAWIVLVLLVLRKADSGVPVFINTYYPLSQPRPRRR